MPPHDASGASPTACAAEMLGWFPAGYEVIDEGGPEAHPTGSLASVTPVAVLATQTGERTEIGFEMLLPILGRNAGSGGNGTQKLE